MKQSLFFINQWKHLFAFYQPIRKRKAFFPLEIEWKTGLIHHPIRTAKYLVVHLFNKLLSLCFFLQVLTEEHPKHFYVIAIAVNANDAPNDVQRVYTQLALAKMTIYITHLLSSVALTLSVCVCCKKLLRIITPVFAVTELSAFVYTALEGSYTIFQLVDPLSRGLVIAATLVCCISMVMCVAIVLMYTKKVSDLAEVNRYHCTKLVSGQKRLVAFYKGIDSPLPSMHNNVDLLATPTKVEDV